MSNHLLDEDWGRFNNDQYRTALMLMETDPASLSDDAIANIGRVSKPLMQEAIHKRGLAQVRAAIPPTPASEPSATAAVSRVIRKIKDWRRTGDGDIADRMLGLIKTAARTHTHRRRHHDGRR